MKRVLHKVVPEMSDALLEDETEQVQGEQAKQLDDKAPEEQDL